MTDKVRDVRLTGCPLPICLAHRRSIRARKLAPEHGSGANLSGTGHRRVLPAATSGDPGSGGESVGESDPIDRSDANPSALAEGVSHEGGGGARPALTAAVAPTTPAGGGVLPSEQLRRLADSAAAVIAPPVPAVDHERELLPAEALARVLD